MASSCSLTRASSVPACSCSRRDTIHCAAVSGIFLSGSNPRATHHACMRTHAQCRQAARRVTGTLTAIRVSLYHEFLIICVVCGGGALPSDGLLARHERDPVRLREPGYAVHVSDACIRAPIIGPIQNPYVASLLPAVTGTSGPSWA
jgi:hypothetical protein